MTDDSGVDPYRFGPPQVPVGAAPTGGAIISASWQLLWRDRRLIWLPVIGIVTGLAAGAALFVPGYAIGRAIDDTSRAGYYAGGVAVTFALSLISTYFQAAVVIGAHTRADGGTPTIRGVLRQTWAIKSQVIGWAIVSTTVGAVLRAFEQRLGIFGRILGFLAGLGWAIVSVFVVPVVVAEGLGPIAAVKRSAELIRRTWGTSVRTTLRFAVAANLLFIPVVMVGVTGLIFWSSGAEVLGAVFVATGGFALIALCAAFAATNAYAWTMIYRFAMGRPVPGIHPYVLSGALVAKPKRRSWRWRR